MSPSSRRAAPDPAEPAKRMPADEAGEDGEDEQDEDYRPTAISAPYGRLGAGPGIAYGLFGLIGLTLLPTTRVSPDDPAAEIAAALIDERGRVSAGVLLTMFGAFFLLVFVAWLHRWLRQAEGEGGWLATLAFGGGVLLVGALLVVLVLSLASTVLDDYGGDVTIARTLLVMRLWAIAITFVPAAAFVGAIGLIGWRSGWLPRWMSYVGMALAAGMLIPPLAYFPFLLSTLWTGMLGVILIQQGRALR